MGTMPARRMRRWSMVMLLAVTLTVVAPDHILPIGLLAHDHPGTAAASNEHTRHCHADAATCTDVPLAAVSGLALLAAWASLALVGALWSVVERELTRPGSRIEAVPVPPPRHTLSPA